MQMKTNIIIVIFLIISGYYNLLSQDKEIPFDSPGPVILQLNKSGYLSGSVVISGTNTPLVGVLLSLDADRFVTHTNNNGTYNFEALPPGWYTLKVALPRYKPFTRSLPIEGQKRFNLNITLKPDYSAPELHTTGGLEFYTYNLDNGLPEEYLYAKFIELDTTYNVENEGHFCSYNFKPGKYHIKLSSHQGLFLALDSVEIAAGKLTTQFIGIKDNVHLKDRICILPHRKARPLVSNSSERSCSLSGTLKDATTNEPIPYAIIFIAPFANETCTDSAGQFVLPNLTPGYYCLTIRMIGYLRKTIHGILLKSNDKLSFDLLISPQIIGDY
jgi:hypothetical protein